MKNRSSICRYLFKIAVSAGLMAFLIKKLSVGDLKDVLSSLDVNVFLLSGAVLFVSNFLSSIQWHLLLTASGIELPFHRTFRLYFVGLFFNNFLPANIGGDAVKIYDVSRIGNSVYQVVAVTVLDRLLGIFCLCLLASAATVILLEVHPMGSLWVYLAVFVSCMMPAIGLYMVRPLGKLLRKVVLMIRMFSIDQRMSLILDYLGEFKGRKLLVMNLIGLSLLIQVLRIGTHILVGWAIGVKFDAGVVVQFFVFVPLLSLAMIPPVTINGLGVREGLGMLLFASAGLTGTDAFMMEFLTYFVSVAISFLGWLFFVARKSENLSIPE